MIMKKMIWKHNGKAETVLFMGTLFKTQTFGFSTEVQACIMLASQHYIVVPIDELRLAPEDYNKIFAE